MPQKLNKAGKMQDYIPAGNGDPSGEYGTSKGTNKNFTTSDKKKIEANVITENKSVVVDKKELKFVPFKEWIKKPGAKEKLEKGIPQFLQKRAEREKKEKDYTITKESFYDKKNDKNFEHDVIDKLPDGWGKIEGALTAPKGYVWVNNKKSLWDKDYQQAIIKKELLETPNKANIIDGDLTGKEMVDKTYRDKNGNPELIKKYKDTKLEDIKKIEAPSYEDISKITKWDRNNEKNNEKYNDYRVKLENAMLEAQLYEFYGNQTKQEAKEIKEYRKELNDRYNKLISNHLG